MDPDDQPLEVQVTTAAQFSLQLQHIVEEYKQQWEVIWKMFSDTAGAPWRDLGCFRKRFPWMADRRKISARDIRRASFCFKDTTGLGSDKFHPRWFAILPEESLEQVADFLNSLEALGVWPMQLHATLIALIPKPKGGKRSIGLQTSLVRLWERTRVLEVRAWREKNFREYNWAAKGRSAQDAVWKQSVTAEAAAWLDHDVYAQLFDLEKCYEMVPLENVWRAGLLMHFPPEILRLELEAFAFARTVVLNGACAEPVSTLSALVEGGSFATDSLSWCSSGPATKSCCSTPSGLDAGHQFFFMRAIY